MWLDNLKELKKAKGISAKQIAELTNLPERTIVRIFSGETPNPYVDTLYRIVAVLDGSLDDVLADSKTVVGSKNLAVLQSEIDRLNTENVMLNAELVVLKDKVVTLTAENDLIRSKLEHKEEIIRLHNYYSSIINGLSKTEVFKDTIIRE
jgi:transcriptional regulator with XRE-family HTH domain